MSGPMAELRGLTEEMAPSILWLQVAAHFVVGMAQVAIPCVLFRGWWRTRKVLPFTLLIVAGSLAFGASGLAVIGAALQLWVPWYRVAGFLWVQAAILVVLAGVILLRELADVALWLHAVAVRPEMLQRELAEMKAWRSEVNAALAQLERGQSAE